MTHHDEGKEIQVGKKHEVSGQTEHTRSGLVFMPPVDIFETENEINLLADMPGVKSDDVDIDLRENTLTIAGEITPFEEGDEEDLLVEYEVGRYFRQFTIPELIDQEKIDAQLSDGVLKLVLPKAEKAKPRKIEIRS
ncbi:MAG: Hsp20/alpha crystallin family protein [Desulfosalsimonadaceae bacterium]